MHLAELLALSTDVHDTIEINLGSDREFVALDFSGLQRLGIAFSRCKKNISSSFGF